MRKIQPPVLAPVLAKASLAVKTGALAALLSAFAPAQTQNAVANGDTRTISLYHTHTGESISATFRVNGSYDYSALEKLNFFLRDWRNNDTIKMDPRLFDVVWETYRESGSREPIHIVSAYRSPVTNAMLRRRSSAVAEFSQHMLGKAMDMHYTDVPMGRIREIGMRLQRGGVGYYPTAGSPFVHLDVGSVRAWPRMNYDQLARLFPDGKTVHLASNGQALGRYDEARSHVESRNGVSVPTYAQTQSKSFFAALFGGGEEEAAAPRGAARVRMAAVSPRNARNARSMAAPTLTVAQATPSEESGNAAFFVAEAARRAGTVSVAESAPGLRGRVRPTAPVAAPAPEPAPVLVARIEPPKPAAAPAPVPVPVPVARVEPQKPTPLPEPVRPEKEEAQAGPLANPAVVAGPAAPLPPRRPSDLVIQAPVLVAAHVPTPPSRPGELGRAPAEDVIARVVRASDLPSVITAGAKTIAAAAATTSGLGALAYAPQAAVEPTRSVDAAKPQARSQPTRTAALAPASAAVIAQPIGLRAALNPAPRKSNIVVSRLDRSNFRLLTAPVETARMSASSVAPVVAPLRVAARSGLNEMIFAEPANVAVRFEPPAALPAATFSGSALRAVPRLDTASAAGKTAQLH